MEYQRTFYISKADGTHDDGKTPRGISVNLFIFLTRIDAAHAYLKFLDSRWRRAEGSRQYFFMTAGIPSSPHFSLSITIVVSCLLLPR
jgi:hypothetical protein